jgi:hypothetical protein
MARKLTVAEVRDRLASEVETIGFVRTTSRPLRLIKDINRETEVFLYPGVYRHRTRIRIDPTIGVENGILRDRLLALNVQKWRGCTRVCHLCLDTIYLGTEDGLDEAAATFRKDVTELGLPMMREFDTLDRVKELLRDPWAPAVPRVAVLFEREKLAVLQDH